MGQYQKFPAGNFLKWVPNPSMLQLTACLEAVSLQAEKPTYRILQLDALPLLSALGCQ